MANKYPELFTPMQIGSVTIQNRFVLEPMEGTNIIDWLKMCKFNDGVEDYYLERAEAGIGLMIPGMVLLRSMIQDKWLDEHPEVFEQVGPLMDKIHARGSKVFFQLGCGWGRAFTMVGFMKKMYDNPVLKNAGKKMINFDAMLAAPDGNMPNRWFPEVPSREMTKEEIRRFVEAYANVALLCKNAGVDGVEVHAVHEGYLLDQFTTKYSNHRTDEYGGSFENRYRFAVEVVQAIKAKCGQDYPVSIRYSVTSKVRDFGKGIVPGDTTSVEIGRDLEEGIKAAKYLQDAGYDMLNADNGNYDAWYWAHPPVYMPLNCNLAESEAIKEVVDIPVICAGRMEPDVANEAIKNGKLDGVGVARQFLTDPQYTVKLREGREDDILPCIACHNACLPVYHYDGVGAEIQIQDMQTQGHCAVNPRTFDEKKYTPSLHPVKQKKHIAVIGAGIGGMAFAVQATLRGHSVEIYEKTGEAGGVFIAAAAPEFKEKDKDLIAWYRRQLEQLSIPVHYNCEVTDLSSLKADEVVIATGAKPRKLNLPGFENAIEAIDYLRDRKPVGETVAVIGGGLTGCEIAYDLVRKGKSPFIVEMLDDILKTPGLCMANSSCMRDLLEFHKVPVYTSAALQEVKDGSVLVKVDGVVKELPCDSVVVSCGYIPGTPLVDLSKETVSARVGDLLPEKVAPTVEGALKSIETSKACKSVMKIAGANKPTTLKTDKHIHLLGDVAGVGNLKSAIWSAYVLAYKL